MTEEAKAPEMVTKEELAAAIAEVTQAKDAQIENISASYKTKEAEYNQLTSKISNLESQIAPPKTSEVSALDTVNADIKALEARYDDMEDKDYFNQLSDLKEKRGTINARNEYSKLAENQKAEQVKLDLENDKQKSRSQLESEITKKYPDTMVNGSDLLKEMEAIRVEDGFSPESFKDLALYKSIAGRANERLNSGKPPANDATQQYGNLSNSGGAPNTQTADDKAINDTLKANGMEGNKAFAAKIKAHLEKFPGDYGLTQKFEI